MDESIDTQDQSITVNLRCMFRKKVGLQFVQHIPGNTEKKGMLAISNICDAIWKRFKVLFSKLFLITFVWKKTLSRDDLADEVAVVTAPLTTGEFDSTVFVNTVYAAVIANSCTFAELVTDYFFW